MNFYFCESCGRRLTEADLEAGKARNKKAKGYYCEKCSTGVNTTEFAAITHVEVRAEAASARPSKAKITPIESSTSTIDSDAPCDCEKFAENVEAFVERKLRKRETASIEAHLHACSACREALRCFQSVHGLVGYLAAETPGADGSQHHSRRMAAARKSSFPIGVALGAASLVALGAILYAFGRSEPPKKSVALHEEQRPPAPVPASVEKLVETHSDPVDPVTNSNFSAPKSAVATPDPSPVVAAPVLPPPEPAPAVPAPTPAPAEVEKVKPVALPDAHAEYDAQWPAFLKLTAEMKRADAAALLTSLENAPGGADLKNEIARDRRALSWLDDIQKSVEIGAARLSEADDVALQQGNSTLHVGKRAEFKVDRVKDGAIELSNGEMAMVVPIDKLGLESRMRLAALGLKDGDASKIFSDALSLWTNPDAGKLKTLNAQTDKAAGSLSPEDAAYLRRVLGIAEKELRETQAEAAWNRANQAAKAGDWKRVSQMLDEFERQFAGTASLSRHAPEIQPLRERASVESASLPTEDMVLWLRADAGITKGDHQAISKWKDQSPLGAEFVQKEAPRQPHWIDNAVNGKPVVRFEGDMVSDFKSVGETGMTIAIVANITNPNLADLQSVPLIQIMGSNHFDFQYSYRGQIFWNRNEAKNGLVPNEWNVGMLVRSPNSKDGLVTYRNSKKVAEFSTSADPMPDGKIILTSLDGEKHQYARAEIAEIIIYKSALGEQQRRRIEIYLRNKYGIK